jgi:hypothetical protein
MDTRYWGPSGWRLLHLLVANKAKTNKEFYSFLEHLPYVLPCRYCRASLSTYYKELPYTEADDLELWMWKIHNKVNGKLRKEGQHKPANPSFAKVHEVYKERLGYGCTRTEFPGWEFLFSIVKNHPLTSHDVHPIPGAPPVETLATDLEKNQWNLLDPTIRFAHWISFWQSLPTVFPYNEWTDAWNESLDIQSSPMEWITMGQAMKSLWSLRCSFEEKLALLNKTTYKSLCNDLTFYKSGCANQNIQTKTCRRLRMTRKTRR